MKTRRENSICYLILAISIVVLFIRCFFGVDWSDEPFYIATANRLYLGDKMIVDEWNPAQISSILLLPFLSVFRYIVGTTEGIVLFFRILYWGLLSVTSLYMYKVLRTIKGSLIAIFATLLYLFYARFTIITLSYNTMAVSFVLLALLIFYKCWYQDCFSRTNCFLFGVFYSIAVLATPHLAICFVVFWIAVLVYRCKFINENYKKNCNNILIFTLVGIGLCVLIFLGYMFSHITMGELLEWLPNLFNEPEYIKASWGRRFLRLFGAVFHQYEWTIIPYFLLICLQVYTKWKSIQLSDKAVKIIYVLQLIILFINFYLSGLGKNSGIIFVGFSMFGVQLYLLQEKVNYRDILTWYIPGLIAAACFFLSSDTAIFAIASGCLFTAVATVMVLFEIVSVHKLFGERFFKIITYVSLVIVVIITIYLRMINVYRDEKIMYLNTQVEVGPAKGLYTTEISKEKYEEVYNAIVDNVGTDDKVLYTKLLPWGYLCVDAECASNSTWRNLVSGARLEQYYELKPERIPTVVFIIDDEYGYRNDENELTGSMHELLESEQYNKVVMDCGTIYKKK